MDLPRAKSYAGSKEVWKFSSFSNICHLQKKINAKVSHRGLLTLEIKHHIQASEKDTVFK